MISQQEEKEEGSAWDYYKNDSARLNRTELNILWALTKVNFNGVNPGKQLSYYYNLYSKTKNLEPKSLIAVLDFVTQNRNFYVKLVSDLKKSAQPNFSQKAEDLFKKIDRYQEIFSEDTSVSPGDKTQIKEALKRLEMFEEYEDFVILYQAQFSIDPQNSSVPPDERIGEVFWKKHEDICFLILQKLLVSHFGSIAQEKSTLQLSELFPLALFVLPLLVPESSGENYSAAKQHIESLDNIIKSILVKLEDAGFGSMSIDALNSVRGDVDVVKASLSGLSLTIKDDEREKLKAILGIKFILTGALKDFVNKRQSAAQPYFLPQKVIAGCLSVFTKKNQQELLPEIMPEIYRIENQSLIYAPFTMAYINSGSLFCFLTPEPDNLMFGLSFHSTKTGAYRDENKIALAITKTVIPYSESAVANFRRSRDALITRKSAEIMSPFDIRIDNNGGVLLLNIGNKGNSPINVYLFEPGDFLPGEFSSERNAVALWEQIKADNPSFTSSTKANNKLDNLALLNQAQEEAAPVVTAPAALPLGGESGAYHPWRKKLEPSKLEFSAFRFSGSHKIAPRKKAELKSEVAIEISSSHQGEEFLAIVRLNDFIREVAQKRNKNVSTTRMEMFLKKMYVRKEMEDLYLTLCPKSKIDYLLKDSGD